MKLVCKVFLWYMCYEHIREYVLLYVCVPLKCQEEFVVDDILKILLFFLFCFPEKISLDISYEISASQRIYT